MSLKILYNAVDAEATGCHRLLNPLFALDKQGYAEIQAVNTEDMRAQLEWADVLVLQCLIGPQQFEMIRRVKEKGIPVVIDYDDNFEALPEHRLKTIGMTKEEAAKNWRRYISLADLVTVPCKQLRAVVAEHVKTPNKKRKTVMLPNYIKRSELNLAKDHTPTDDGQIRILYSCSDSHLDDFKWIGPVLKRLGESYPQVTIISHGTLNFTYHFPTYKGKAEHHLYTSYQNYHQKLIEISPHICIGPLRKDPHAICRSDIKFKQTAAIKAAFVGSNLPPYQDAVRQGETGFLVGNRLSWWWTLRKLIRNPKLALKVGKTAYSELGFLATEVGQWYLTYQDLIARKKSGF